MSNDEASEEVLQFMHNPVHVDNSAESVHDTPSQASLDPILEELATNEGESLATLPMGKHERHLESRYAGDGISRVISAATSTKQDSISRAAWDIRHKCEDILQPFMVQESHQDKTRDYKFKKAIQVLCGILEKTKAELDELTADNVTDDYKQQDENNSDVIASDPSISDPDLTQKQSRHSLNSQQSHESDLIPCKSVEEINDEQGEHMMIFHNMAVCLDSPAKISKLFTQPSLITYWHSGDTPSLNNDSGAQNYLVGSEHNSTASNTSEIQQDLLSLKDMFESGTQVTNSENLLLNVLQRSYELNIMERTEKCTLICHNLAESSIHRSSQDINPKSVTLTSANCKMFYFNNSVAFLIAKLNNKIWKLSLYLLATETQLATCKPVSYFSNSIPEAMLTFDNCIAVSHKDGGVIILTVVNDRIIFHVFSKGTSVKKWVSTYSILSQPQGQSQGCAAQFKTQSSIVVSSNLYCSLVQQGVGARVCQFNTRILQQQQKGVINVRPTFTWHIKEDPTLENCFISVHIGKIIIICCSNVNNRTIMEVKRPVPNSTAVSPAESRFEFPYIVKVAFATVVPCPDHESLVIAIVYHNIEDNNCYIKRINMSSHCFKST